MSKEQQKQMLELKYQMEKLQSEMEDVEQKEKRTKKYERKASLKQKPNLDFMEDWLEKSAILKDYYESEDQPNHWYKLKDIMKHPDVKNFIDRLNINLEVTPSSVLYSNLEYIKLVDNIEKKMSEMKEFYQPKPKCLPLQPFKECKPDSEKDKDSYLKWKQRYKAHVREENIRCSRHPSHKLPKQAPTKNPVSDSFPTRNIFSWSNICDNQYPSPSQIKFVQSVYNMFKIQQEKIDKLEKEIEQIKKYR